MRSHAAAAVNNPETTSAADTRRAAALSALTSNRCSQTLSPNSEVSPIGDLLPLLHIMHPESPPKSLVMGQATMALMIVVLVMTIPMVMTPMETTWISVMRTMISLTSLSKMTLG